MLNYSYEIDENGAVWIYDGVNPEPFMHQPTWPNNTPWKEGEASKWADQVILSLTDSEADLPGDSPEEPTRKRPAPIVAEAVEIISEPAAIEAPAE